LAERWADQRGGREGASFSDGCEVRCRVELLLRKGLQRVVPVDPTSFLAPIVLAVAPVAVALVAFAAEPAGPLLFSRNFLLTLRELNFFGGRGVVDREEIGAGDDVRVGTAKEVDGAARKVVISDGVSERAGESEAVGTKGSDVGGNTGDGDAAGPSSGLL
jgi:hypothetical protein